MGKKLKFGLVGMGFGAHFAPILKYHPSTELYALCRRNSFELEKAGKYLGVSKLYTDFEEMISLEELNAILIMSPVSEHYTMAKMSLEAGKHTAVTVPMAETKEQCIDLLETRKKSGKVYMRQNTVFTRFASTEYEYARLARLLVRFSADAIFDSCIVTATCPS